MRIEWTEQQRRIVQEQGEQPVDVLDPSTQRVAVLLAREHSERLRSAHHMAQPGWSVTGLALGTNGSGGYQLVC